MKKLAIALSVSALCFSGSAVRADLAPFPPPEKKSPDASQKKANEKPKADKSKSEAKKKPKAPEESVPGPR